jgi:hypothetical protein
MKKLYINNNFIPFDHFKYPPCQIHIIANLESNGNGIGKWFYILHAEYPAVLSAAGFSPDTAEHIAPKSMRVASRAASQSDALFTALFK